MSLIILNGDILAAEKAGLAISNRSFRYGDGLFETIRIYEGKFPFWNQHLQRLESCAAKLGFQESLRELKPKLVDGAETLVRKQGIKAHGRMRITVYREAYGAYAPDSDQVGYLIEASPFKNDPYTETPPATLLPYRDINLQFSAISGCKTTSALVYVLAAREARKLGYDEALLFAGKQVAEASSSNIFAIRKGKVYTPPLTTGCLQGVMRDLVIELCEQLKIPVLEKKMSEKFLYRADEVFLTSAIRGVVPVNRIGEMHPLPEANPLTLFLRTNLLRLAQKYIQQ